MRQEERKRGLAGKGKKPIMGCTWDELETWNMGGSRKTMGVILADEDI